VGDAYRDQLGLEGAFRVSDDSTRPQYVPLGGNKDLWAFLSHLSGRLSRFLFDMVSEDLTWQIESVEQKIQRARHHLADLEERMPFEGSNLYSITRDLESDARTEVYRFRLHNPPLPVLAAIVGDFINNACSTLNHLAIALHMAYTGVPTEEEVENIEFPIVLDSGKFERVAKKRIWGANPQAYAIIERNQPYHRGNAAFRWLYVLARVDRHRKLNLLYQQISALSWVGDPDGDWIEFRSYEALEDGAVIGRFRWTSDPDPGMQFHFACDVALSDGKQIERTRLLTNWIYDRVIAIRDELSPFYDP